jgi:hypothetical protein
LVQHDATANDYPLFPNRSNKEQEKYYSGKRSNHTFKTQMVILPNGRDIVDVVAGEPGPKSDITLFP